MLENRGEIGLKIMIVSAILAVGFALAKDPVSMWFFYGLHVFGAVLVMIRIIKSGREEIKRTKRKYAADKTRK